jgi:hypothetical protein
MTMGEVKDKAKSILEQRLSDYKARMIVAE